MNTKNLYFSMLTLLIVSMLTAQQNKYEQDVEAIKSMCGCYEVSFKYTETFSPDVAYEKAYDYTSSALEWAFPIVDEEGKISLQHLLVLNDDYVIKHWRQDWIYEETKVFSYHKDQEWHFFELQPQEVKGTWTQKVYQVDDSPRYAGTATWVHVDGRHFWESKDDSPLPRREYSKRDDYNVMNRGNKHELTNEGWVHEQDNKKILRSDGKEDVLIAEEKGFNTYVKVDDSRCAIAQDWWKENKDYWVLVNKQWEKVYNRDGALKIATKVEDKPMFMHLTPDENTKPKKQIKQVFDAFILD